MRATRDPVAVAEFLSLGDEPTTAPPAAKAKTAADANGDADAPDHRSPEVVAQNRAGWAALMQEARGG